MAVSRRRLLYLLLLSLSFAVGTLFGACLIISSSHSLKIASGHVRASKLIRARDMFHVDLHKTRSQSSEELSCEEPLRLIVLVFSAPSWTLRRDAIRMSWIGMYPTNRKYQVTVRFVVGMADLDRKTAANVEKEVDTFGDMLLLPDHHESYENLTKKLLHSLQWVNEHMNNYDYLLKCDDDSFVQIDRLIAALKTLKCPSNLYWGYYCGFGVPLSAGRWRETRWFICPHYLPYALGGGYVLSRKLVQLITNQSRRLRMYTNEDVTVATWLSPYRITAKHDLRFDTNSLSRGCNNQYIVTHKQTVRSIFNKRRALARNGTLCTVEKEIHPAYVYNWSASPENCCRKQQRLPMNLGNA